MKYLIEALLFLLYFAFGISWMAYSPLLADLEAHFGVTHAQGGMLISLVSLAKAFVPMLAGVMAARLGLKRALALGGLLAASAVVAPFAPSFTGLLALRFLFGVGGAIVVTLMGPAVMAWFPRNELPLVNGLNNVAVNAGITVALFTAVPAAAALGWQTALAGFGLVVAALTAAWILLGRDADTSAGTSQDTEDARLGDILKRRETWLVAVAFTGPLSLYLALNTWLPTHYQEAFGLSRTAASQLTGLFNLVGIPAAIAGGLLTARLGLRRPLVVLSGLILPVASIGLFASPSPAMRTVSAVFLGAAFFLYVSPLFTIPMELPGMTPRKVALMMGCVFSLSYVASTFSPMVVGWLRDATGSFLPGLSVFAATSVLLALGGALLPETGPGAKLRWLPFRAAV